ncbi:MAG: sigma 54-interacting transcriptional regulator [Bryobacteraceae bacterium]
MGGRHTLQVDVRFIAATNQNLARMVQAKKFRVDLFQTERVSDDTATTRAKGAYSVARSILSSKVRQTA